jgi:hypothetical protein
LPPGEHRAGRCAAPRRLPGFADIAASARAQHVLDAL